MKIENAKKLLKAIEVLKLQESTIREIAYDEREQVIAYQLMQLSATHFDSIRIGLLLAIEQK